MTITPDSQAILLLCAHLGLSPVPEFAPLSLREWNPLSKKIQAMSLRPGDLLDLTYEDIQKKFDLPDVDVERIAQLLQRSGTLAIELERLSSLGIFVLTRADADYPLYYRQRLKESSPAVLFYTGEKALLDQPGIAVVGSRHLDETAQLCAELVGNSCGYSGQVLFSGGAKGVDRISMNAALNAHGFGVGILAASLEKAIRDPENRPALIRGDLCLVTPYSPDTAFSIGTAMGRNKLIYALADYAIVVASDVEKGGTWAGAIEALKAGWVPVFVLDHPGMPEGNRMLLKKGGLSFPHPFLEDHLKLREWLDAHSGQKKPDSYQPGLF